MPRLVHRPPQYRLHKSTKQAVVSFFGKQIFLGPYGSDQSHRKYQEVLQEWQQQRRKEPSSAVVNGEPQQTALEQAAAAITIDLLRTKRRRGEPVSLCELILVYRRHTHAYYRKGGDVTREAGIIDDALRALRQHSPQMVARDFGPVALRQWREAMVLKGNWSRKYINKQINRIRQMFQWAVAEELIDAAQSVALKSVSGLKKGRTSARETPGVSCVADAIVEATIASLPQVVADMVRIQRLTSARPGEICSLGAAEIDRTQDVWVYRPSAHKTEHFEKGREICIGPQAQKILLPYLERLGAASCCFSPADSERQRRGLASHHRKTPLSCGNRSGSNRVASPKRQPSERYTTDSYRRAIHRACDKLGIEKWSPNRLRHTASTEIRKRFGLEAARAVDGHSSVVTTEIYAELDLATAMQVMRELG